MMSENLKTKIADFDRILNEAVDTHLDGKELVGVVALFSGGNDSTILTHLARQFLTHAAHANTTIGSEHTRQFVRDVCSSWELPLLEHKPPMTYREHVLLHGFPGPAMHYKMYQQLKERCLRSIRRELVQNGYRQRVLYVAGRRRAESSRRSNVVEHERIDSVIWASPLANWTKADMEEYRTWALETGDTVPVNPIAIAAGMSMECCCGAFAEPGEFDMIERVDPAIAQEIVQLEADARAAGVPAQKCRWGWGAYRDDPDSQPIKTGAMCSSCDARWDRTSPTVHEKEA